MNGEQLLYNLEQSELLSAARFEAAKEMLRSKSGTDDFASLDGQQLIDLLCEEDFITHWQGRQLRSGRYKGFFLKQYKLLDLIAVGGMARVYRAEQTPLGRNVAIKVLPRKRLEQSSCLQRFQREAQAIASLDHPNIVRAFDIDMLDEVHFIVMEFIAGLDVQRMVEQQGPLDYAKAADYIRQAAEGLSYAHRQNLIHRDVKPGNLMIDASGTVKLLDMGLALIDDDALTSLTITHDDGVLGTADYLAPEQAIDSHIVDGRADIYGLGCTMYYMLTGHPPFPEGTLAKRIVMHQKAPPDPIRIARPDIPSDLEDICMRMLEKKRRDRQQSGYEVADQLMRWLVRHGHASPDAFKDVFMMRKALDQQYGQMPEYDDEEDTSIEGKDPDNIAITLLAEDTFLTHAFLSDLKNRDDVDDDEAKPFRAQTAPEPVAPTYHSRNESPSLPPWAWVTIGAVIIVMFALLVVAMSN